MSRLQAGAAQRRKSESWQARRIRLGSELLEVRCVLSVTGLTDDISAVPAAHFAAVTNTTPVGLTPAQVQQAYGFNGITFQNGTIQGQGQGQTIAIVDAYNDPNIKADLHTFDQTFGLADPPSFTVYQQIVNGQAPRADAGWSQEIALDVEWAHAMAPQANIVLVEASTSSLNNLLSAVDYARSISTVSVLSMSWGSSEFSSETSYDSHFTTPSGHQGITFVASAGDSGAGALWPAASSNVLAVGGTTLSTGLSGSYAGESAWSGSGGAMSTYEGKPSYQTSLQTLNSRSIPDVAYDANPSTGFAVFDSVSVNGRSGWFEVGGTSAGAPQWAALVAIADQGRALAGRGTLSNAQAAIATLSSSDFHDVTTGSNGNAAKVGYDLVTGRGSPIAGAVVNDLVGLAASPTFTIVSSSTPQYTWSWLIQWLRSRGLNESSPMLSSAAGDQLFAAGPSPSAAAALASLSVGATDADAAASAAIGSHVSVVAPAFAGAIPPRLGANVETTELTTFAAQREFARSLAIAPTDEIANDVARDAIEVNQPEAVKRHSAQSSLTRWRDEVAEVVQLAAVVGVPLDFVATSIHLSANQETDAGLAKVGLAGILDPELADAIFSATGNQVQAATVLNARRRDGSDSAPLPEQSAGDWKFEPAIALLAVSTAILLEHRQTSATTKNLRSNRFS